MQNRPPVPTRGHMLIGGLIVLFLLAVGAVCIRRAAVMLPSADVTERAIALVMGGGGLYLWGAVLHKLLGSGK